MKNIEQLFDRYVDGQLSDEELLQLESWIADDPENAKQFLQWSSTNLDTHVALQSNAIRDAVSQGTSLVPETTAISVSLVRYVMVAMCAMLLTIGVLSILNPWSSDASSQASQASIEDDVIARVLQRIDCVMESEKWATNNTGQFESGQSVLISKGLAIIEFNRGAKVTLEGPAELEILTDNSGFLHAGKLTASVPESAIGFEILTPKSRVVDHGTEFGVSVDANGDTETHVFKGEVELFADSDTTDKSIRLTESEAAKIGEGVSVGQAATIPANPQGFIRVAAADPENESSLDSISRLPATERLAIWLEASQGVQLDADSRVISWQNLANRNRTGSGGSAADNSSAWQVNAKQRPRWEEETFAKRPSIRFGGFESNEFLATTPIEIGPETTILVVCSFGKVPGDGYGHIMSLSGRAKLILERRSVRCAGAFSWIFDKDKTPKFRKHDLDESKEESLLETPLLLAIRYGTDSNTFQFFQNGELQSEGEPTGVISGAGSHIIGCDNKRSRFFFNGQIAEILVYDQLLDRKSLDQASEVLLEKYQIDSTSVEK